MFELFFLDSLTSWDSCSAIVFEVWFSFSSKLKGLSSLLWKGWVPILHTVDLPFSSLVYLKDTSRSSLSLIEEASEATCFLGAFLIATDFENCISLPFITKILSAYVLLRAALRVLGLIAVPLSPCAESPLYSLYRNLCLFDPRCILLEPWLELLSVPTLSSSNELLILWMFAFTYSCLSYIFLGLLSFYF